MHTAVLPADRRLTSASEFSAAVRGGVRAGGPLLVVHLRRAGSAGPVSRAGLVVNRQVGGAVVRNRVKRRLRHLLRDLLERAPAGSALVVRALPASATASSAELGAELARCLDRTLAEARA